MFAGLLSPSSYGGHVLHESLYLLVLGLAVGYAIVLWVVDELAAYAERIDSTPEATRSEVIAIAVRDRWVWIAPIWTMACLLVLTLIPQQSRAANVFMYRFF